MDEGAEAFADSEIKGMIESHISNLVQNQEAQKTNLEEENLVQTEEKVSLYNHFYNFAHRFFIFYFTLI